MTKDEPNRVVLENAREEDQRRVMEELEREGICPFCPEGLLRCPINPPIHAGKHWIFTTNHWPYENTLHHFLLIHICHAENIGDINEEAWQELLELLWWAEKEFGIESGGIGIRFGDPARNGGTVNHLHVHLIVANPDITKPGYVKRVRFPMGPKPIIST